MTISKSRRDNVVSVLGAIILGIVVNIIWEGLIRLASLHFPHLHVETVAITRFVGYVASALIGVFLGRELERQSISIPLLRPAVRQSQTFVLEVEGTQPLDSDKSDWGFFLTNCTTRILRSVHLSDTRSEIGAYDLCFSEIPVMQPGQKVPIPYKVYPRRDAEKWGGKIATLWDFGTDHANERGNYYIWYDIQITYRDQDSESFYDAGVVGVCFDLSGKILKTEGAEYFRRERERFNSLL